MEKQQRLSLSGRSELSAFALSVIRGVNSPPQPGDEAQYKVSERHHVVHGIADALKPHITPAT